MLKLRLSRGGTKKRPVYKVVVADSRFARDGRFIEKVGFFNPLLPKEKKERIGLEAERIKYWLGQGAQPTTRVARILGENELMPMPANGNNPQKAIPKKDRKKEGSEETKKEESSKADAAPAKEAKKEAEDEARFANHKFVESGKLADDPIFAEGIVLCVPEFAEYLPMCVKAFGLSVPTPHHPPYGWSKIL